MNGDRQLHTLLAGAGMAAILITACGGASSSAPGHPIAETSSSAAAAKPSAAPASTAVPAVEQPPAPEPTAAPEGPAATEAPAAPQSTAPAPVATGAATASVAKAEFDQIDDLLKQTALGNIAYNKPDAMLLDETKQIQLLLSPVLSGEDLGARVTPGGEVVTAAIRITSRMQAELKAEDPDAFDIQPLHADAVQLVAEDEPTEWKWAVTAQQEGRHRLHLTLHRLIEFDGKEYWRKVKEYEDPIVVDISFGQRLARFDWYWALGLVIAGLVFPAVWWWLDRRKKSKESK